MINDDVFDIQDFSVATPWERFISEIEEALRAWITGEEDVEHEVRLDVDGMGEVFTLLLEGNPRDTATSSTAPSRLKLFCVSATSLRLIGPTIEPRKT